MKERNNPIYKIKRKFNDLIWWVKYRTTHRYHYRWTGLPPGYSDPRNVLLHVNFQILVDFIEIEKGSHHWWHTRWDRKLTFREHLTYHLTKRFPKEGMEYLLWEMGLLNDYEGGDGLPSYQAICANEEYELYNWWKNIYPNRPEPMDASGWSELWDKKNHLNFKERFENPLDQEEIEALQRMEEIEKAYDDEDEAMLIRLMKIRLGLWT